MLDKKIADRINSALNFQEADQVPFCDFLDNKKISVYFSHKHRFAREDKIKAYDGLRIDVCWRFERRKNHRQESLLSYFKRTSRKTEPVFPSEQELREEMDDFREQQKMFEPYTCLAMSVEGCLSVAYRNMGFENFCEKMYLEPLEIDRMLELHAENILVRAREFAVNGMGPLFFITDDIAYNKGLIFSPVFLRQNWLPKLRNAITPLKEKNIKVILHSDGNINDILDDLIDIGIDGIHPVDREAGMNIGILKKKYGKSLLLFGNVVLYGQNTDSIVEQTKDCFKKASFYGGHFIGSNSGIDKNIEMESIFSLSRAIKEYGKYPIQA